MNGAPRRCYAKGWDPVFSKDREFKEDWAHSYVDQKRDIEADFCYGIDLFFDDFEESDPDDKFEELKKVAASASLEDLKAGSGSAGQRQGAWLDERSYPNRCITSRTREHKNPLTAAQLYKLLGTPVCEKSFLPPKKGSELTKRALANWRQN
jgi:hypothetical protein